ncbi:cyclin-Y-like protein 1 [Ctenodactylus gundi]
MGKCLSCCMCGEPDSQFEIYEAGAGDTGAVVPEPGDVRPQEVDIEGGERDHRPHISDLAQQKVEVNSCDYVPGVPHRQPQFIISCSVSPGKLTRKYNSCSTIFVDDSTALQPNPKDTLNCVTMALYYLIRTREGNRSLDILDDRTYPLMTEKVPEEDIEEDPDAPTIYGVMYTLFTYAHLPPHCAVACLIYIERLLSYWKLDLCPSNWRRIVMATVLLAGKFWVDWPLWNGFFSRLFEDVPLKELNALEKLVLQLLEFNLYISDGVYGKYYFDLRTLASAYSVDFLFRPLTKAQAQELEAMSRVGDEKATYKAVMGRSASEESVVGMWLPKAVVS